MQAAGVKNLQFPPTPQNLKDYFRILGNQKNPRLSNKAVLNEFQKYVQAFYYHEGNVGRDTVYDTKTKKLGPGKGTYDTKAPDSWDEVTDRRNLTSQGQRHIDCEGYAYMAKELLGAAGFKNSKFVVVGPPGNPEKAHVMFTAERNDAKGKKEVSVVSNDKVFNGTPAQRDDWLTLGYPAARGGPREEDSEQWKASYKYESRP